MRIGIIGGGITGLTIAYYLAKNGIEVTLFEQSKSIGGLAGSITIGNCYLEKYYHHIFKSDIFIINLIKELGLEKRLIWSDSKVGFLYHNKIVPFSTPLDMLKFYPLRFTDRLRLGSTIFYFRNRSSWNKLEVFTIEDWFNRKNMDKVYKVVWKPLLKSKFGDQYNEISLAWLWGRIHPRVKSRSKGKEQLGYVHGGFQLFFNRLKEKIEENGGTIRLGEKVIDILVGDNEIKGIETKRRTMHFDSVISTIPLPELVKMGSSFPDDFIDQLKSVNYRAIECIILVLERSLSDTYWLNICDDLIPFGGIVEHTNFISSNNYNGNRIAYFFRYLPYGPKNEHKMDKNDVINSYFPFVKQIFPLFERNWIRESMLSFDLYATPIYSAHYSKIKPRSRTPIKKLYLANTSMIYPEDRSMNNCVRLAKKIFKIITED